MNRFRLPYHLIVEDGIFEDIPACIFQGRKTAKIEKIIKRYGIPIRPSENGVTEESFL